MKDWRTWIEDNKNALWRGNFVEATSPLPPPQSEGFKALTFTEKCGQSRDWALSLTDGSRIHIHEYPGPRYVVHRDKWDPDANVFSAAAHVATETKAGIIGGTLAGVGLVGGYLLRRWRKIF